MLNTKGPHFFLSKLLFVFLMGFINSPLKNDVCKSLTAVFKERHPIHVTISVNQSIKYQTTENLLQQKY